ncbi:hypothetical protein J14TS2_27840 [Bacillus sp. J14TS2]|uniref:PadR family transcriptional regulator n=1 Tax=Bacillus sp. J14TS2 TaxID=2807188 RepID=UPI001B090FEA|nr:PadR family transcriptional regulator [Bacillus sp. J14TS2]GIN72309.1 hypothetical protein J14TS2_27840 [Bacillus sp. J14TS2]
MRRRRGFIPLAILHLLAEESMHGYQIMKELEERSDGAYVASAGTIYPALQELLDQQLIELDSGLDKKVYSINQSGLKRLEEMVQHEEGDFWTEWKERMIWRNSKESLQLRESVKAWERELRKAMKQTRGNPEDASELIALINKMTERLKKKNK